eukprot:6797083-Ditylum_brightwellii.AAC.1
MPMDINDLETHFTGLSRINRNDSDFDPGIKIKEIGMGEIEEAIMALNADQIAAITATANSAA